MEIVVLDGKTVNPGDNPWNQIAAFGKLTVYDRTPTDQILSRAGNAAIILTNKTPLAEEVLLQLPALRFVGELATGFDNVDVAAAGKLGIPVANVPEYSTDSVAQHTMALILEIFNRIGEHALAVKEGEWCRSLDASFWKGPLVELVGKKLGIVGFGRIGKRVAEIAFAFGMEILAFNPRSKNIPCSVPVTWVELDEIFSTADIVSLHCPLTAENRGFVDYALLSAMKETAVLINTARGALINEGDLANGLINGRVAAAALDVVSEEPISQNNPLLLAKNCLITPHIAWASLAARRRLLETTAENISAFLRGTPINLVNRIFLP